MALHTCKSIVAGYVLDLLIDQRCSSARDSHSPIEGHVIYRGVFPNIAKINTC